MMNLVNDMDKLTEKVKKVVIQFITNSTNGVVRGVREILGNGDTCWMDIRRDGEEVKRLK